MSRKVEDLNNWMSPKGLQQLDKNLNDKQKEAVKEIGFDSFCHLQADTIPGKLMAWLAHNFDTCL